MNTPTPIPPLSPLAQSSKSKANVRIAVITIVVLHAVFFGGLLMQGCRQKAAEIAQGSGGATNPPPDLGPLTKPAYPEPTNVGATIGATQHVADTAAAGATPPPASSPLTPPASTPTPPAAATPAPAPVPTPAPAPPTSPQEYVVAKGDIPANIAKAHHVSTVALLKANPGLDPRRLKVGQKLVIPVPAAAPAAAPAPAPGAPPAADTPEGGTVYVVKKGDNLTKIAREHGVGVKALRAANKLKTDQIHAGQKLTLPAAKAPAGAAAGGAATATGQ